MLKSYTTLNVKYLEIAVIITPGKGEKSSSKEVNRFLCMTIVNVDILRVESNENVEMLSRRETDNFCVQNKSKQVNQLGKLAGEVLKNGGNSEV